MHQVPRQDLLRYRKLFYAAVAGLPALQTLVLWAMGEFGPALGLSVCWIIDAEVNFYSYNLLPVGTAMLVVFVTPRIVRTLRHTRR